MAYNGNEFRKNIDSVLDIYTRLTHTFFDVKDMIKESDADERDLKELHAVQKDLDDARDKVNEAYARLSHFKITRGMSYK